MNEQREKLEVVVVGGGMITHDQILPSLYQLRCSQLRRDGRDSLNG